MVADNTAESFGSGRGLIAVTMDSWPSSLAVVVAKDGDLNTTTVSWTSALMTSWW